MQLPDIQYGPVQQVGGELARVTQARDEFRRTIEGGLQALHAEVVRTQKEQATAELSGGLSALETQLAQNRYLSTSQIKSALGEDYERLPKQIRDQVEPDGKEKAAVPTWVVGGALYEKGLRELVQRSGEIIGTPGFRGDWETQVSGHLAERRMKANAEWIKQAHENLRLQQGSTIDALVRQGQYDDARTQAEIATGFYPGERAQLVEKINGVEQAARWQNDAQLLAREVVEASRYDGSRQADPTKAEAALNERIKNQPPAFQLLARGQLDHALAVNKTQVDADFGRQVGIAMQEFTRVGPDGKPLLRWSALSAASQSYFSDPRNGREVAEYKRTFLAYDQAERSRARGERMIATDEQARNAVWLDSDMAAHPEKYRGEAAIATFLATWLKTPGTGGEPPLSLADYQRLSKNLADLQSPGSPVPLDTATRQIIAQQAAAASLVPSDPNRYGAQHHAAVDELTRRTTDFVQRETAMRRARPDDATIRKFVDEQLTTQEVQHLFGLWTTTNPAVTPQPVTTSATVPGLPVQPGGPKTVVGRVKAEDGSTIVKYSDGTFGKEGP